VEPEQTRARLGCAQNGLDQGGANHRQKRDPLAQLLGHTRFPDAGRAADSDHERFQSRAGAPAFVEPLELGVIDGRAPLPLDSRQQFTRSGADVRPQSSKPAARGSPNSARSWGDALTPTLSQRVPEGEGAVESPLPAGEAIRLQPATAGKDG